MRRPIRRLAAALALLGVAALSACASIPTSGGVHAGTAIVGGDQQPFVFRPAGPAVGASPEQILRGFVAAAVRPQGGYETAQEFLTPEFAGQWNPNAGVLLHEAPNVVRDEGDGSLQLMVTVVGQVGRGGNFIQYGDPIESTLRFELVQVDGEWRIAEAPDGVVLLRQTFERVYTDRTLYFYDPDFQNLVPDVRWFPNGPDTPTRVVEALLAGPAAPLAPPVLASAFPGGTSMERPPGILSAGELTVDLDPSVLRADDTSQQRMQLQLTRSLIGGSIVSVRMRAGGVDVETPGFDGGGPVLQPQVDPRAAIGVGDSFGWLTSGDVQSIDGLSPQIASLQPTSVALDASARRAVVGYGEGAAYVNGGGEPVLIDPRPGLAPPTLDTDGYAWSVPRDDPAGLQVSDGAGAVSPVSSGWNDLSTVASIGVSRDGTRLFVYGDAGGAPVLRVHGVVRDGSGRPQSLSDAWFELAAPEGTPVSATWVGETSIASLGRSAAGDSRVLLQTVGGASQALSRPDAAIAIVGANGENGLRVLTEDGELQALRGAGWQVTARDVRYVANQR